MAKRPAPATQITREIRGEELRFVSMQIDATGTIVEYRGIDLPEVGLRARDVLGENILDVWTDLPILRDFAIRLLAGEPSSLAARVDRGEGLLPLMYRIFGSPVRIGGQDIVIIHAFQLPNSSYVRTRDYQETLRTASETDSLTNTVNRRRFNQELRLELELTHARKGCGAVIYMDIDDFKAVNDTLGHAAGDEVLVSITRCLRERLRDKDVLGRLGGDEFAILAPGVDGQEAVAIARRLLRVVREHRVVVHDVALSVTMSVGIALYPAHGSTADEVLAHADCAMYKVKDAGRNEVAIFDPKEDSKANSARRLRWKHGIAEALTNDRFLFQAQPIVDLATGETWRHEILLRMRDSRNRLVLPASFLKVAQRSGFMNDIDHWVSRQAMRLAKELGDEPGAGISFNLSPTALQDDDLLAEFERVLRDEKIDASRLCIEVTEAAAVSSIRQSHRFLSRLKDLGALVALDDFGAGFSSLSQLKNLPVDYLKIDGSFIHDLRRNKTDQAFARAIGEVARGLGMKVIAEFVGDAETVALLREYGIDYGQGYFLGRPIAMTTAFPTLRTITPSSGSKTAPAVEAKPPRIAA